MTRYITYESSFNKSRMISYRSAVNAVVAMIFGAAVLLLVTSLVTKQLGSHVNLSYERVSEVENFEESAGDEVLFDYKDTVEKMLKAGFSKSDIKEFSLNVHTHKSLYSPSDKNSRTEKVAEYTDYTTENSRWIKNKPESEWRSSGKTVQSLAKNVDESFNTFMGKFKHSIETGKTESFDSKKVSESTIVAKEYTEISIGRTTDKAGNRILSKILEGEPCLVDSDCLQYLPNFNKSCEFNSPAIVRPPICIRLKNYGSQNGVCKCELEFCPSRSKDSVTEEYFYYCGPCGRMGSSCSGNQSCDHNLGTCDGGFCSCNDGQFYNVHFCIIPYYGYEQALQVAIITCIFVALCLLAATVYSSVYIRRRNGRVHPYILRLLARRANAGTRNAPPGDTPPKYDDVVEEPPTYQQALEMVDEGVDSGEANHGYEEDSEVSETVRSSLKSNKMSSELGLKLSASALLSAEAASHGSQRHKKLNSRVSITHSEIASVHSVRDPAILTDKPQQAAFSDPSASSSSSNDKYSKLDVASTSNCAQSAEVELGSCATESEQELSEKFSHEDVEQKENTDFVHDTSDENSSHSKSESLVRAKNSAGLPRESIVITMQDAVISNSELDRL